MKSIIDFFDKLEDQIRGQLSRYPIWYALIGGTALILFWRGIWHGADDLGITSIESILIGLIILLITGLFTSVFIGDQIIMSGLKHSKKINEITAEEIKSELEVLSDIKSEVKELSKEVEEAEKNENK